MRQLFKHGRLLSRLVFIDMASRYKGTILGFLWSFLNPLVNLVTLWFIFTQVVKTGIHNFPLFLAIGYVPWIFLGNALSTATTSILNFAPLLKNVFFPRQIIPLSQVISNFFHFFLIGNILLIPFAYVFGIRPGLSLLLLPVLIVLEFFFVTGLSLVFSCLQVQFRDAEVLLRHFLTFWFYVTPIFYSPDQVPARFQWVIQFNPMTWIVTGFRKIILYNQNPGIEMFCVIAIFSLGSFWLGEVFFRQYSPFLAEEV